MRGALRVLVWFVDPHPAERAAVASESPIRTNLGALSLLAPLVAEVIARVSNDVALVIDEDGVIRSVAEGPAAAAADFNRWVGRRWVDIVSADTRRKIELMLDESRSGEVTQRREVNHPVIGGEDIPMAWTALRLGDQGPVVAVGRDLRAVAAIQRQFLDAQHEMELDYWQRRHADSRYRTLFHVASDAVVVLDAATFAVAESNEAARSLWNARSDDAAGRPLIDLLPAAVRPALAEFLVTARSSGRGGELRLRLLDDGLPWDVTATPFRAEERQQLLVRARRLADEEGASTSPSTVRQLMDSTPDGVVVTDSAGRIKLANPAFIALVQRGADARVVGQRLGDVVGDVEGAWEDLMAKTRLHGLCPRTLLEVSLGDVVMTVDACATLLADEEQEHLGFILRTVGPTRADDEPAEDAWEALAAVRARVGLQPLESLVREGVQIVERMMIETALRVAGGRTDVAARMLQVEPRALSLKMLGLDLAGNGTDDNGKTAPPRYDA